jgi:hypothetical protein
VNRFAVLPDGTRLVSAGVEEAITLWDLTERRSKPAPVVDDLLAAWRNLASLEGAKGVPAIHTLLAGGSKSIVVIDAGIDELLDTRKKTAVWLKELGSDAFAEREAASRELHGLGIRAVPDLYAVIARSDSPEVKRRAAEIIERFAAHGVRVPSHGLAGDDLQLYRAVEVLEKIGSRESVQVLARIEAIGGAAAAAATAAINRLANE